MKPSLLVQGFALTLLFPAMGTPAIITRLAFESGEIEVDPNGNFLGTRSFIAATGRTFRRGTNGNSGTLVILPFVAAGKFSQGAVWPVDPKDAMDVLDRSVLYVGTSTLSDVANSFSQRYKADISAGMRSNGQSVEGEFSTDTIETQLTTKTLDSSDPTGINQQKVPLEDTSLRGAFRFSETNWNGGVTTSDLGNQIRIRSALRDAVPPRLVGEPGDPEARFLPDQTDDFRNLGTVDNPDAHNLTIFAASKMLGTSGHSSVIGLIVEPLADLSDLTRDDQLMDGLSTMGNIVLVPEPASLALAVLAILAPICFCHQLVRRSAGADVRKGVR